MSTKYASGLSRNCYPIKSTGHGGTSSFLPDLAMAPALKPLLTIPQNTPPPIMTGDTSSLPQTLMTDATWDLQQSPYSANSMDTADWGYYTIPLSPPTSLSSNTSESPEPSSKKLRLSVSPDRQLEGEHQRCVPTQKVFDLPEAPVSSPSSASQPLSNANPLLAKKFFATTNPGARRTRGTGERISTKDFVPPDVSGLSKREARLVKNRAAAFLSRQRKREEFEAMEVRVRQLEDENARLQQLAQKGNQYEELRSEIEHLQAQLQAAEKRELNLSMEIAGHSASLAVKAEMGVGRLSPAAHSPEPQSSPMIFGLTRHILAQALPHLLPMSPKSTLPIAVTVPLAEMRAGNQLSAVFPCSDGGVRPVTPYLLSDCPAEAEILRELDNVVVSFERLAEDRMVRMRIQSTRPVSVVQSNPVPRPKVGDKPRSSSLGAWSGSDITPYGPTFELQQLTSSSSSLPMDASAPAQNINNFCGFLGSGGPRTSPDYQGLMMPYMQPSFSHVPDQVPFDLVPQFVRPHCRGEGEISRAVISIASRR
ncbi:hypothetical protein EDC04DRAFT_2888114 [Pisolithus marmoratus]|nr:hypothetical protein EDC04DRAFT_2888114 [Pisolithus marmoratus]